METTGSIAEPATRPGADDEGLGRLAELVEHLTDCPPQLASAAVRQAAAQERHVETPEERLLLVARAMLSVRDGVDLRE